MLISVSFHFFDLPTVLWRCWFSEWWDAGVGPADIETQHLSYDVWGDYQNCSVLYCVLKLCTVINTLIWAVLTVLWIWLCHTGPISLCINLFVFILCVFVSYCEHGGVDLIGLKPNL